MAGSGNEFPFPESAAGFISFHGSPGQLASFFMSFHVNILRRLWSRFCQDMEGKLAAAKELNQTLSLQLSELRGDKKARLEAPSLQCLAVRNSHDVAKTAQVLETKLQNSEEKVMQQCRPVTLKQKMKCTESHFCQEQLSKKLAETEAQAQKLSDKVRDKQEQLKTGKARLA